MTTSIEPSTLIDRMEVTDTLNRMAWCQDRRLWADLADLLAEEVQVGYGGPDVELVTLSREDLLANWRSGLARKSSQHVLTSIMVDVAGGDARTKLNETVWLQAGPALYQFGNAMECDLRRTPTGWRITRLKVVALWHTGDPTVLGDWQRPNE